MLGELHPLQRQGTSDADGKSDDDDRNVENDRNVESDRNIENDENDDESFRKSKDDFRGKIFFNSFFVLNEKKKVFNNSIPTLVGIISWGLGCARPTYPGNRSHSTKSFESNEISTKSFEFQITFNKII